MFQVVKICAFMNSLLLELEGILQELEYYSKAFLRKNSLIQFETIASTCDFTVYDVNKLCFSITAVK